MDKLRALEYFAATAHEGSFSAGARALGVSAQAVTKLVGALERSLESKLFDRTSQGMSLTAAGARYLEECLPALEQLHAAEERTRDATNRSKGTVVVGIQHAVASTCVTAALPRFHALYPEIELDVRDFPRPTEANASGIDVMLILGWPELPDLVHRRLGAGRFIVVAAPSYWAAHGVPQRPKELEQHECFPIRGVDGTIMDLWTFVRSGVEESALARGWLTTSNPHRDVAADLALAGEGVIRIIDWMHLPDQRAGRLVRVLADWESSEAPPLNLMFRPSVRRIPRVKAFIDFITALFRDIDSARGERVAPSAKPIWLRRRYARTSVARAT